ncbi:VWA domain-containing protein [Paenibacillus sp. S150]|uniref:vWA domain-containing protein n=1 Tax=Paenibacillus sp. S150 TaxID=2749826 RepID=UPI001C56FABF|nr:VWA domain-containing protein [Paenibacillus sp. S150]MBW4082971.1 VWA domain-containing protein [Paenibacillus sp. S150]
MDGTVVNLTSGSNAKLDEASTNTRIKISCNISPAELDLSCFMVGADGRVPADDYFIFYNQPADPKRAVRFEPIDKYSGEFVIDLQALQSSGIEKCVFAATLDGPGTFADVRSCKISAAAGNTELVYTITESNAETSLVLAELYRYGQGFKLRAVGRGFHGGLKPLAEAHGVEVGDAAEAACAGTPGTSAAGSAAAKAGLAPGFAEAAADPVAVPPAPPSQPTPPALNPTPIDLLKQKVNISLRKKNIDREKARVAVVFDASGSMTALYQKGVVQRAFERILAVAASMDDDCMLDVWFFATKSKRMPSVGETGYANYVKRTYPGPRMFGGLGVGNNEPVVMADIIKKYTKEAPGGLPAYIVFFSDGGIYETSKISKLLIDSSRHNIFWQFVGLGNADYGVLRELDDLRGRYVDNADFFALDDPDEVSDEDLYDRLFNEFPKWLHEAREKGIVRS